MHSPDGRATAYPGRRRWRYTKAFTWLEARPELTPGEKRLYSLLVSQAGGANLARNWTVPKVAQALGCTERSVTSWLAHLIEVGLLERQPPAAAEVGHRYFFLAHTWLPPLESELDR